MFFTSCKVIYMVSQIILFFFFLFFFLDFLCLYGSLLRLSKYSSLRFTMNISLALAGQQLISKYGCSLMLLKKINSSDSEGPSAQSTLYDSVESNDTFLSEKSPLCRFLLFFQHRCSICYTFLIWQTAVLLVRRTN